MNDFVFALGSDIYNAAVAGAKRGYNRSTDDYSKYESALNSYFEKQLEGCSADEYKGVMKKTKGDWRNAYLPIELAAEHRKKAGFPCQPHARVYLPPNMGAAFDIPMECWISMVTNCPLRNKL